MKLIICEKYNQGEVVANAVLDSFEQKKKFDEPYWDGGDIFVVPLQGQIFEISTKESRDGYPSFPEIEWKPRDGKESKAALLKKFLSSDSLDECIIASDFDREGELIGTLGILVPMEWKSYEKIHEWDVDVTRMRYSALIEDEIEEAWNNRSDPDENLFHVGKARSTIDFRAGINLSKAITKCLLRARGEWKQLSTGRVQTPTLKIVHNRCETREDFEPDTYWNPIIEVEN